MDDNNEKIRAMAAIVVALQSEHDVADHDTTTATFMYGDINDTRRPKLDQAEWLKRRNAIMGPIEQQRTEAIWSLSKLLSDADHRRASELLGRGTMLGALALACGAGPIETIH